MKMKNSHWLLLIVLATMAFRLAVYQGYTGSDAANYVEEAHNILKGEYSVAERLAIAPFDELMPSPLFNYQNLRLGFILPNTLFMKVFGINEFAVSIFPFTCAIILILSVYHLGRQMYSEKAGIIAAIFAAFVPQDMNLTSAILPHMPAASFMALSACLFVRAIRSDRMMSSILFMALSGFTACYSYTIWEFGLFILPVLALFLLIMFNGWYAFLSGRFWILGMSFMAGFLVLFGIETAYFYNLSGEWLLRPRLISRMGRLILDVHPVDAGNLNYMLYPAAMMKSFYFSLFFYIASSGVILWLYSLMSSKASWEAKRLQSLSLAWFFFLFLYLQWGSSSLTEYTPTFKLIRYLTVVSAPGSLLAAFFMDRMSDLLSSHRSIYLSKYHNVLIALIMVCYAVMSVGCAFMNHLGNGPFERDQTKHFSMNRILNQYPAKAIYTDGWTARLLDFTFAYERDIAVYDRLDLYDKRRLVDLEEIKDGYVVINHWRIGYAARAYKNKSFPSFVYNIPQKWVLLEQSEPFHIFSIE